MVLFSPDGKKMFTAAGTKGYFWKVPQPMTEPADKIQLWTEALTGLEVSAQGEVQKLSLENWLRRRGKLLTEGGPKLP